MHKERPIAIVSPNVRRGGEGREKTPEVLYKISVSTMPWKTTIHDTNDQNASPIWEEWKDKQRNRK
jgi:hypothetical protein